MNAAIRFTLSYEGSAAAKQHIDLYDASQALMGFQRSLALTTHLVINDEIITQAPSLKGAKILALPAEEGSWKMAAVILSGVYAIGTAPKDTPLGHIIYSVYDYVVSESLGVHVDYDSTLGQLYDEATEQSRHVPKQHKVDSLIEKCTTALTDIHRPIVKTGTALEARITAARGVKDIPVGPTFDSDTYDYIYEAFAAEHPEVISGRVSSYNSNTFKGRLYVATEGRSVAFELSQTTRFDAPVRLIVASLSVNALKDYKSEWSTVHCAVIRNTSRSGHLKSYTIIHVSHTQLQT